MDTIHVAAHRRARRDRVAPLSQATRELFERMHARIRRLVSEQDMPAPTLLVPESTG